MFVAGLDLGNDMGFAEGEPGTIPYSAQVQLKRDGQPIGVALGNLMEYLVGRFTRRRPDLCVRESFLPLAALLNGGRVGSEDSATVPRMMAGVVEAVCNRFGVRCESVNDATWRKHFVGMGRTGDRETSKRLSLQQCWRLRYLDRSCFDTDRAEACGIWDYAGAVLARVPPKALVMYPPQPEPKRRKK